MVRMLADENFNLVIVRGVIRRYPEVDIVRAQVAGLSGADDPTVLEWAAQQRRVLLTHDVNTVTGFAHERVRNGLPMPGVFEISRKVQLAEAIEDLALVAICSEEGEWEGQVVYLPLRQP